MGQSNIFQPLVFSLSLNLMGSPFHVGIVLLEMAQLFNFGVFPVFQIYAQLGWMMQLYDAYYNKETFRGVIVFPYFIPNEIHGDESGKKGI